VGDEVHLDLVAVLDPLAASYDGLHGQQVAA
jgi:hypothetical protein